MAAIGPGWADGAWVEASWIPAAWGAAVVEPEADTLGGVWLAGLRRQRLRQVREAAEAESRKVWRRKQRSQKRRREALAELQAVLIEAQALDLPEDDAEAIAEALEPFEVAGTVDWETALADAQTVAQAAQALLDAADALEELEIAFVMLALQ